MYSQATFSSRETRNIPEVAAVLLVDLPPSCVGVFAQHCMQIMLSGLPAATISPPLIGGLPKKEKERKKRRQSEGCDDNVQSFF